MCACGNGENEEKQNGGVPSPKYTLIAIDMDTTGRRVINGIVQLSAYTPEKQYSQYIIPRMNLNPGACRRHQLCICTIGHYRKLKCLQTSKLVNTKSEFEALKEFLDWIEGIKMADEDSLGVILIHYEERKFVPYVILQALKKYDMLERFFQTVKGFSNGYELGKEKCSDTFKNFSLRQLSKILLAKNNDSQKNEDQFQGNARVRARIAYQIVHQLAKDPKDPNEQNIKDNMIKLLYKYTTPINNDLSQLDTQNKNVERENSFRPVFLPYFKCTLYHRIKAVNFRMILSEKGYDYKNLKTIWNEKGHEELSKVIQAIDLLKSDEKTELIQILDCHFDPAKEPMKPTIRKLRRHRNRDYNKNNKEKKNFTPKMEEN